MVKEIKDDKLKTVVGGAGQTAAINHMYNKGDKFLTMSGHEKCYQIIEPINEVNQSGSPLYNCNVYDYIKTASKIVVLKNTSKVAENLFSVCKKIDKIPLVD